jgi:hypothetical protein
MGSTVATERESAGPVSGGYGASRPGDATILFAAVLVHADSFARLLPTGAWAAETYALYILGAVSVSLLGAGRYSTRRGRRP